MTSQRTAYNVQYRIIKGWSETSKAWGKLEGVICLYDNYGTAEMINGGDQFPPTDFGEEFLVMFSVPVLRACKQLPQFKADISIYPI